ncbi:MAG: citramalate synthase [Candidatus Taylorbacteria bacterium]|nr:citramalate synthase [Candidatus Taylorbacteria bacterium]
MFKPEIEIYDTTLRDGSQGLGINFSVADKLLIAKKLDDFGVQYIEGGWPGSNPKDIEFFKEAQKHTWKNATLAAFGSTRKKNTRVEDDAQVRLLLEADTPVVTIFGKTWLLHVTEVLGTTWGENLVMIGDTVRFLKSHGKFVIYDAEHAFDGYKDNPEYATATWLAAQNAGADRLVLCDTNGGCLPNEIGTITEFITSCMEIKVGIHTHNDLGLAVSNAISAVNSFAIQVQGTINGYGERTGNCNLITAVSCLQVKMGKRCVPEESIVRLVELARFVDNIANMSHDPRQPVVGEGAFAHKGGVHLDAVRKVPSSYEHIDPAIVGNSRRVLMSDLSGKANVLLKATELGVEVKPDAPELKVVVEHIKSLEHFGYEFEGADGSFQLLLRKELEHLIHPFFIDSYNVSIRRDGGGERSVKVCDANIQVSKRDVELHTVARGDGPVNALDNALRKALTDLFPGIDRVHLVDYKVRILNVGSGSASRTRVFITFADGERQWTTVGADDSIIEASLIALRDGYEYWLLCL